MAKVPCDNRVGPGIPYALRAYLGCGLVALLMSLVGCQRGPAANVDASSEDTSSGEMMAGVQPSDDPNLILPADNSPTKTESSTSKASRQRKPASSF